MQSKSRWNKPSLLFCGIALWGVFLIGCVSVSRTVLAPPHVPGADFVGSQDCALCHTPESDHFKSASHARLALADPKLGDTGCEACHGPGSIHSKAGGGRDNIVNPGRSPESCLQCHLDKRGEFHLPHAHGVGQGNVSCSDCHEPHSGPAIKGGTSLETTNETCTKCHTAQKGPFVFEHGGVKLGCTTCHSPHGSVNQKMLVARDANLCLQCHLTHPPAGNAASPGQISVGSGTAVNHPGALHNGFVMRGTCWSAGCHEAVHGSNASKTLRY